MTAGIAKAVASGLGGGMEISGEAVETRLHEAILRARERVYRFGGPTPLKRLELPGDGPGPEVWVKREDLSAIKSYKWRGAGNRMALLDASERGRSVVTASAGNHAQGVALAANKLGIRARIYMPRTTPRVKLEAVRRHGGAMVEIVLAGDSYDEAMLAARSDETKTGAVYIHAYDDLAVMAGQGTLADEVVMSGRGPFDAAYLQIGGGGMAAGVSNWLRGFWPGIEIVGVEGEGQASMKAALSAGEPVGLEQVDIFCDGTAVRKAGAWPFAACRGALARIETVSNAEVSGAIRVLWEGLRCVSEPSGAMGVAAVSRERAALAGKRVLVIVTGANIDFLQIGLIAQTQGAGGVAERTLRIQIPETRGTMLKLLGSCFGGVNISDFQYGKFDAGDGWPVFTVSAENADTLGRLTQRLTAGGYDWEDITGAVDVRFRAIPLRGDLLKHPAFFRLDFYERPGALYDFLANLVRDRASFCYFNYRQSGERVGRALIGFEFVSAGERDAFVALAAEQGEGYRSCVRVDEETVARLTGDGGRSGL